MCPDAAFFPPKYLEESCLDHAQAAPGAASPRTGPLGCPGPEGNSQSFRLQSVPAGYVNTLGTTCVSPIYYEVTPTNGEACQAGWMNIGAGYCKKKKGPLGVL